jgi:hypothetical protein
MKNSSGNNSPKETFFKKMATHKPEKTTQKFRTNSKETIQGRYSLETLKKKRETLPKERHGSFLKPAELAKYRDHWIRDPINHDNMTGKENVALYSEQFRMKTLPFAYKEFERSYSRLKKYLDRLSLAGDKIPFTRQSHQGPLKTQETSKTVSNIYGRDDQVQNKQISSSQQTKFKDSPTSMQAMTSQSKLSFQDASMEELVKEFKTQEEKLIFCLKKMNLPHCDRLALEPLEMIKKAIEIHNEVEREESHTMFVSLSNENYRLTQRTAHLEKELEKEGMSHTETLHNFEEKIGQLNDKINNLHQIILEKDTVISICNEKLKLNNLEQISQGEAPTSARQPSNNSKSIFEDFDIVIKSLLSDIKAKEDYLEELRENREVTLKEATTTDNNHVIQVTSHLKSNNGPAKDDLVDDVATLKSELRHLSSRHAKTAQDQQEKFARELSVIRATHQEEKEILEIKVRALEQELCEQQPHLDKSPSSVIDELQRKYAAAVAELQQLKDLISKVQKSHSKSNGSGESEQQRLNPNSKRSLLEGSNVIPDAVLAESKCIFESLSEESPSVKRAITEALRTREQAVLVREDELKVKEEDVHFKLEQTEKWAKNAENLINQKIQEINEAKDDLDLKAKELVERERRIFEREMAGESKPTSANSTEQLSHRGLANVIKTDEDSIIFNEVDANANFREVEYLKEHLNQMGARLADLERTLQYERNEKEREKFELRSKSDDLLKTIEINSILLAKLRELGLQYDKDQKVFIPYVGNIL